MFAVERLQRIREIILKEKRIDVTTLSRILNVSEVTVRRDLEKLENEGLLYKTYGGAVLKENTDTSIIIDTSKEDNSSDDIIQISNIATKLINDGDTIFLGSGEINLQIASSLSEKTNLVIVTNDLSIANELFIYNSRNNFKKIITGGNFSDNNTQLLGQLTILSLKNIFLDKAFISVEGIDMNAGYTVNSFEEVSVISVIKEISKETYVTADIKKFNRISFTRLGPLTTFDSILTNKEVPTEYKNFLFQNYVKLYTFYDLAQE